MTSPWRMLRRTPMAVIHSHGPSIRHDAMLPIEVRMDEAPNRASSSPPPRST